VGSEAGKVEEEAAWCIGASVEAEAGTTVEDSDMLDGVCGIVVLDENMGSIVAASGWDIGIPPCVAGACEVGNWGPLGPLVGSSCFEELEGRSPSSGEAA